MTISVQAAAAALEAALELQLPVEHQCELRVALCEVQARMFALLGGKGLDVPAVQGDGGDGAVLQWQRKAQLCLSLLVQIRECTQQAASLLPLLQQISPSGVAARSSVR
jgi:hypothetical protein